MPHRATKSRTRTTLRPTPFIPLAEGVNFSRNGVIIDASKCSSFNNWEAAKDPNQEEDHSEEGKHAPHADGSEEGGPVAQ